MGADKKAGIPVAIRPWYSVAPQNTLEYTHSNTWISMEKYGTSRKRKARKPLLVAGFLGRAWKLFDFKMVPEVGIEPTRTEVRWILSPFQTNGKKLLLSNNYVNRHVFLSIFYFRFF